MLKLSKIVPARRKTEEFTGVRKDFITMSPRYREIRSKMNNTMCLCHWCKRRFDDGEGMALASRPRKTNVVLCHNCADDLALSNDTPTVKV